MSDKYVDGIVEENFDAFLAALRSGEYAQGKMGLENRRGEFCCLGVACNLAWRDGQIDRQMQSWGQVAYDGFSSVLPKAVATWLGLPERNLVDGVDAFDVAFFKQGYAEDKNQTAVGWNDSLNKSFAEIADAFEQEFTKESV